MSQILSREITANFKALRKLLRKNGMEYNQVYTLAVIIQSQVEDKIGKMKGEIERHHTQFHTIAPKESRYIVEVQIPQANIKMTFRPSNGEILLKLPKGTPQFKLDKLNDLAKMVMNDLPVVPSTLRGTPKWSETKQSFHVTLQSNSKHRSFTFDTVGDKN